MKNSKLMIIVGVVVLLLVVGAIMMMKKPQPNTNQPSGENNNPAGNAAITNDAVDSTDTAALDSATNDINPADFSDSALDDLG